ncbi:MoaD/ThiS family protein [Spectribacter hydrogenoxidans]|uniref:MoaD/ThiS family protein n=1 Tax=Spectribacter hydrogenoxidans TaxID=3075608 RepID=A0ABU3BXT2_9GAMM|nr:MoaD/ThiS family protein [Salinisphaera sp. W335]MDT0634119.1 MoaD/ThiS family protein [Salinisphaera sp. W335]
MQVTVEGHGVLAPICGDQYRVELPVRQATVADVLEALAAELPDMVAHLPRTACAKGDTLVQRDDAVADGDHLALIPPVSGG